MSFGDQTVVIVTVSETGAPGYLGMKAKAYTKAKVQGCHFRPTSSTESPKAETNTTQIVWKLTAPPEVAALAAKSTGQLVYDGSDSPELLDLESDAGKAATYQIDGPIMPKYDFGELHHVTIMCKRQAG